jgi:hypothetical protein
MYLRRQCDHCRQCHQCVFGIVAFKNFIDRLLPRIPGSGGIHMTHLDPSHGQPFRHGRDDRYSSWKNRNLLPVGTVRRTRARLIVGVTRPRSKSHQRPMSDIDSVTMSAPFSRAYGLVGTSKVYSGMGADIVMESITRIDRDRECNGLWLLKNSLGMRVHSQPSRNRKNPIPKAMIASAQKAGECST